ncbi:hypothetical protein K458DRAFT_415539 [Lentithecium fluviatile CBS 122367]|uniref:Uncharacterized protein n=1 Tax=Lentithecium fluviatile CBS 122367 TaxID=1168545 RepID=A0A6G1JAT5_9PLEO|nr:hypothetical protein K458DRAFT_415539 [Lentithecium fluviatile CBS 122367]
MERTPSPPRRVRTPPAPIHGAKYDSYEPFSPRRSSRVAAQIHLHPEQISPARTRTTRAVTPTCSSKKSATRPSNHTLSPPSSPNSPANRPSPRSTRHLHHNTAAFDSDSDHAAPTPARRFLSTMPPRGMLPTPSKTPRKRAFHSEQTLGSTARVLFANRPPTIEEHMPTPRKVRKTKDVYTLESFEEEMNKADDKIPIFTDSKERIPTRDPDEDNPFVTKKGKGKAKAPPPKPIKRDEKDEKIFEAAAEGKGMVWTFRGKKTLRKYEDNLQSDPADDGPWSSSDELQRKAGTFPGRLTRSSVKPRLLFQEELRRRRLENGDDEDEEEAVTDIEVPIATPSRMTHKAVASTSAVQEATPPPTNRVKRQISFESWSRVKSSARTSSSSRDGKKRSGTPLESPAEKRARTR